MTPHDARRPGVDPSVIRILTADAHPLMRTGVAAVIAGQPAMQLVAEAQDGREAIDLCLRHRPNVMLMEIALPHVNGIEATRAIRSAWPAARLLILTACTNHLQARRALHAGACGYVSKHASRHELLDAIRLVHHGRKVFPADLAFDVAARGFDGELSPREVEVLGLVAIGSSNKRIALTLGLTADTIKAHVRGIMRKLDAKDRTHAVTSAYKRGLIDLSE